MQLHPYEVHRELFDLSRDPGEQVNLADSDEARSTLATLEPEFDAWWESVSAAGDQSPGNGSAGDPGEVEIDDEVVQRLRDLGYLE